MNKEQFPIESATVSESMKLLLDAYWIRFVVACKEEGLADIQLGAGLADIGKVWLASDYVAEFCIRQPKIFVELLAGGCIEQPTSPEMIKEELKALLASVTDEDALKSSLRQYRQRFMVCLIWQGVLARISIKDEMLNLSALADACVSGALDWSHQHLAKTLGVPCDSKGKPQRLAVFALGKLGANELNLSSDIDLMFAYPETGMCIGQSKDLSSHEFFLRLGQKLISVLSDTTIDGFVFRVDMRLRPYGDSGALAISFSAMERYYENQGREWERFALIKIRPIAGDAFVAAEFLESISPFVYRRYIDYGVFDSLREMKSMIVREVTRKNMQGNIKLGGGGIREAEFIVQVFQLLRGGREHRLRDPSLLRVSSALIELKLMPEEDVVALLDAYLFLRKLEHRLQGFADKQTQTLPQADDECERIAYSLDFESWSSLLLALQEKRECIAGYFKQLIQGEKNSNVASLVREDVCDIWFNLQDPGPGVYFDELKPEDRIVLWEQLVRFSESRSVKQLQGVGKDRLDRFMPLLLSLLEESVDVLVTFERVLAIVENILRRSAYLVLLFENPHALQQLLHLCGWSSWVAEQLALYPFLLDELLDAEQLYEPPSVGDLQNDLRQQLLRIPEEDLEQQMDVLRYFKSAHVLRVAAAQLTGRLPLMEASDYLTAIANAVVNSAMDIAWRLSVEKNGWPQDASESLADRGFVVLGYGKFGGLELGYTSDLDLVFLHNGSSQGMTNGAVSVSNVQFYTRLAQRLIHILSARTNAGVLYEVDVRLRPSGASGLLVCSMVAFQSYQHKKAWTWEHQALVRVRAVVGSDAGMKDFGVVRSELLSMPRDDGALRADVLSMRNKMRNHLDRSRKSENYDLKQGVGGIVDIEFMVQYTVLKWAHKYPELGRYSDNIRLLEMMAKLALVTVEESRVMSRAYLAYRTQAHLLALQNAPAEVGWEDFESQREGVKRIWQRYVDKGS